jgi:hypothetical protein
MNSEQSAVKLSVLMLVVSIMATVGSWMVNAHGETWKELVTVPHVGALIGQICSVVLAWFGKSPSDLRNKSGP